MHEFVVAAPALDHHLGFVERREDLAVEQFVPELGVEALAVAILPGTARLDEQRLLRQACRATVELPWLRTPGPLSERMCSGGPCSTNRSARQCSTSSDRSRRATTIARQRRVNSSMMHSIRNALAVLRSVLDEVVG